MAGQARKIIHVAVGVIWREGRILIARRPDHAHQGGLLEFPGGKVEAGESVQQALARELLEETAVTVAPEHLQPLIGIRHDYGDKEVFLDVWQTRQSTGEPHGVEGQPVFWRTPDALTVSDFPAANGPIIAAIRLPEQLAITGDAATTVSANVSVHGGLARAGDAWVMLRMPSLASNEYTSVIEDCLAQSPERPVLAHDRPDLVADLPLAGVHLSWGRAAILSARPVPTDRWFGVSCHDPAQLAHAVAIGADYATLGPVLPTPSHPDASGIGWQAFAELVAHAGLPVYALGGVGPDQLARARVAGAQGIAGISWWWPANHES